MYFNYVCKRGIKNISKQEWQVLFLFFFNDDNKSIGYKPDDVDYLTQRFNLPSKSKITNLLNNNSFLISRLSRENYNLRIGFQFIVDYISNNGFLLISKKEWEKICFYAFVLSQANNRLAMLHTNDIYNIADDFKLRYEETSRLIKSCYSLEDTIVVNSLTDFFNNGFSPNVEFGSDYIKLEVINPLALEALRRLLISEGVVQDSSLNRNIVKISTGSLDRLIGGNPVRNIPDNLKQIIREFTSYNDFNTKYDEFIRQYREFRNREAIGECKKLFFKFLSSVLTQSINVSDLLHMLSAIFG